MKLLSIYNTLKNVKGFMLEHKAIMITLIIIAIIVPMGIPTFSAVFGKDAINKTKETLNSITIDKE